MIPQAMISALLGVAGAGLVARIAAPDGGYRSLFERAGIDEGVDPNLLHAIAWHESNFQPDALSPANRDGSRDYGLMQINRANLAALGLTELTALEPESSVRAAARLIREIQRKNANLLDTLAVYNAGPSAVAGRVGGPKLDAQGRYINLNYVLAAGAKFGAVLLAYGVKAVKPK